MTWSVRSRRPVRRLQMASICMRRPISFAAFRRGRPALMHGARDVHVPYEHSVRYAELSRNAGEPVSLEVLEDGGHFAWLDPRLSASRVVQDVLAAPWT